MKEGIYHWNNDGTFRDCPEPPDVYDEIKSERIRADEKYGYERNERPEYWVDKIIKELHEVFDAMENDTPPPHDYETELKQVASLCIAAIESYRRQKE